MARRRIWVYMTALLLVLGAVLWATLVMAASSSQARISPVAATINVTTTGDTVSCGTPCSLRGAIAVANSGDTINIPAGTYTLTLDAELSIDKNLTLNGAGSGDTIIQVATSSADATSRVFNITGVTVAISGVAVQNGNTGDDGDGILNSGTLTLTNSTVSGNTASNEGGGIFNYGTLTLTNSTVSGNTASRDGGGILNTGTMTLTDSTVSGNIASGSFNAGGGGILNNSTLTMINSTVNGNFGGGILNNGGLLTLSNSTVSNNTGSGFVGGIVNIGTLSVSNSTIRGNTGVGGGSGGIRNDSGTLTVTNTIIAGNTAATGPDCSGSPTSLGHNLIGDASGCGYAAATGDLVGTGDAPIDPLLGPLADNGGPTKTHALLPGSPAIDHIPVENCTVITDQRGIARPQGAGCDIGAFEANPGDANGDGVVNVADLRIVAAALGTTHPRADLNNDGIVDIRDLAIVAINLGR